MLWERRTVFARHRVSEPVGEAGSDPASGERSGHRTPRFYLAHGADSDGGGVGTRPARPGMGAASNAALCGICGSDAKQVALHGTTDNPMTGLVSFPQVLGHEVVASVEAVGPGVEALAQGSARASQPLALVRGEGFGPGGFLYLVPARRICAVLAV